MSQDTWGCFACEKDSDVEEAGRQIVIGWILPLPIGMALFKYRFFTEVIQILIQYD